MTDDDSDSEMHLNGDSLKGNLSFDPNQFDIEPEIWIREDDGHIQLDGDAESFTVEKEGVDAEIYFEDGEWKISPVGEGGGEKQVCPHQYCENWQSECDKH